MLKLVRSFLAIMALALFACSEPSPDPEIRYLSSEEAGRLAEVERQQVSVDLAEGLAISLWAPRPLVAAPVAIDVDHYGRLYMTRTTRRKTSDLDIRDHRRWMTDDLSLQTVEDKRAFLRRELAPDRSDQNTWLGDKNEDGTHDWRDLTVQKERIYRIEDTSGDGRADQAQLFIEDFHTEVTGVAGGVTTYGDDVFVAVAPDVWRLRDTAGDGMADFKESISHGYGVHFSFAGHGMSGLAVGPDGRVYWSIGDIGLHVEDGDGHQWSYPNEGAIMRSNPDGSEFEVFARGLRNAHEFAFDERGNLVTVDNDGDRAGEHERIVYVVDGSDSGWRINWQFGKYDDEANNSYNVWMDEELYKPRFDEQAAYIVPPVAPYHTGPAGMVYNPGTALTDDWNDFFLVAEFTGSPTNSRISAFRLEESGASFRLVEEREVVRGILPTGLSFGPDGALYIADWLEGWDVQDEGRIWKLDAPDMANSPLRAETRALLAEDLSSRDTGDLARLMRHADMRVRIKAQFELVSRGDSGQAALVQEVGQQEHLLSRLHGIWGIGQMVRAGDSHPDLLLQHLSDNHYEVRAQVAKVLGEVGHGAAVRPLIERLSDEHPRVRFFAAEALGRIGDAEAIQPLIQMLEANEGEDPFLRHAGSLALVRIGDSAAVAALRGHPSRAVRIAAVVALRRMRDPAVASFLTDSDEYIVAEAARAINDDQSIEGALADLAEVLSEDRFTSEPLLRRAIGANLRVGEPHNARIVAEFASRMSAPETLRVEALAALGVWHSPSPLDRVDGWYRGHVDRDPAIARDAAAPVLQALLADSSPAIRRTAAETAGNLRYADVEPELFALVHGDASPNVRAAALSALHDISSVRLSDAVRVALLSEHSSLRTAASSLIPVVDLPDEMVADLLATLLDHGSTEEQQSALAALAEIDRPEAHEILLEWFEKLSTDDVPREIRLDILEAASSVTSPELAARVEAYEASRRAEDPIAQYGETLWGGNAERGRDLFYEHTGAQCIRCHAIGQEGGDVGPDLTTAGERLTREQLLQSLVNPSERIAPGYGIVTLVLTDGRSISGTLRDESDSHFSIDTGDRTVERINRESVTERRDSPSSMPPMGGILNRRELRDVVEFLSTLD